MMSARFANQLSETGRAKAWALALKLAESYACQKQVTTSSKLRPWPHNENKFCFGLWTDKLELVETIK